MQIALLTLLTSLSFAQESTSIPEVCRLTSAKIVAQYQPRVEPKYFFKPVGTSGTEITYVGYNPKTQEDENYLFNTKTGETHRIPGRLDPIGLFGHDLVTVPLDDGKGGVQMAFYDLRELKVTGERTAPILPPESTQLDGRYQSLGVLSKNGKVTRFRVFTDGHGGGDFRDFEADFSSTPAKLKPLAPTRVVCNNRKHNDGFLNIKLPMMSKDGKQFSGFDVNLQEMKLFNLDSDGNCTDTGVKFGSGDIGKLDFSPTGNQVAFHFSDRDIEMSPLTFGAPEPRWGLKGTVYDLKTNSYILLPFSGKKTNTYYPAFLPNGNVLAVQKQTNEAREDSFQYLEIDLKSAPLIPAKKIDRIRALSNEEFEPYRWLSQEWNRRCSMNQTRGMRVNRLLSVLSLSQQQCRSLVDQAQEKPNAKVLFKLREICQSL